MNPEVRIAFASGVRHARDYAGILRDLPGLRLTCIAEDDTAPAWAIDDSRALASDLGLPLRTMTEALADCDATIVCSEPARHAELARRSLAAGRHVLIDKPPAITSAEFAPVVAASRRHPELVVTGVHRLLSPAIVRARGAIDSGGIGLPLSLDFEWLAAGGLDGTTVERPELVCDPRLSGGGELTNFGWYPILALQHLSGLPVQNVAAFGGALFGGPHADFAVEDSAVLSLGLARGVAATITVARVPAGLSGEPVSSTGRIIGSHGHLVIDESTPFAQVRTSGDGGVRRHRIGGSSGLAALRGCFTEFRDAILTGRPVTLTIDGIAAALGVLDAARTSLRTGATAPVGPA